MNLGFLHLDLTRNRAFNSFTYAPARTYTHTHTHTHIRNVALFKFFLQCPSTTAADTGGVVRCTLSGTFSRANTLIHEHTHKHGNTRKL